MVWYVAVGLIALAGLLIMRVLDALLPSASVRSQRLEALLRKADRAERCGKREEARKLCLRHIRLARRWFGKATPQAAGSWYTLAVLELTDERHEAMAEAAGQAVAAAAEHEGFEWFAMHGRELRARALGLLGSFEEAHTVLDEAEAIQRARDPAWLSVTLLMRARLAWWSGEIERSVSLYEQVFAGLGDHEVGDGAYRQRSPSTKAGTLELEPLYREEALAARARVLFLANRDAEARAVVAQLIEYARRQEAIDGHTASERLHAHAARIASCGLMDGPAETALAATDGAEHTMVDARIQASIWAWCAGDWRGARESLETTVRATSDGPARARALGQLAFQHFACGDHDAGERLMRQAREVHDGFEPSCETALERASSLYSRGRRDEAASIVEARSLRSDSVEDRARGGIWALHRSLTVLSRDIATSLERRTDGLSEHAQLCRVLFLSGWSANAGAFDEALSLVDGLELPLRRRSLCCEALNMRGWLLLSRGRASSADETFLRAWGLRATTMDARMNLAIWTNKALAEGFDSTRAESPEHHAARSIFERLPPRDHGRFAWLGYEAQRHLAAGDAEAALSSCDDAAELDAFWFGAEGAASIWVASNRSRAFQQLGRTAQAVEEARRALALAGSRHPDEHPAVARAEHALGLLVDGAERRERLERALRVLRAHDADGVGEIDAELKRAEV